MKIKGLWLRFRFRQTIWVFVHDLCMVPIAWLGAIWLRFNLEQIPAHFLESSLYALGPMVLAQGVSNWWFNMYRGVWRFASLPDLYRILKAVASGVVVAVVLSFLAKQTLFVPRSVPVLYGILLLLLLAGPRALYRWLKDTRFAALNAKRVLIVGAGQAGEMLVRDLLRGKQGNYVPIGLVDDRRRRQSQDLHGVPILGGTNLIPDIAERHSIDLIILAIPSATSHQRRRIVERCEKTDVPLRTVPDLMSLLSGDLEVNQLREVSIDDLLGREAVTLDWPLVKQGLSGRKVLVTGGGGSIGSELCRQLSSLGLQSLVVFESNEFNLYRIDRELRSELGERLKCVLGDVRDRKAVAEVFESFKPDVVFHAAAYKHVPLLEDNVRQAVTNNVFGTINVARTADQFGCHTFVLISTDKAVNPTNVMGATKRVAEVFCQNLNQRSKTRFVTVRFGNVLGSAGSVVPLFQEQIKRGGPVTVTHPAMTRYFMTIPEASQLILESSVMGNGGEIFVLDMGDPVKISYMAEQMIRLAGKTLGEDIQIAYTGLRPGEKLVEELFHESERLEPTEHDKVLLARHRIVKWDELTVTLARMSDECDGFDTLALLTTLRELVPEFQDERLPPEKSNVVSLPLEFEVGR